MRRKRLGGPDFPAVPDSAKRRRILTEPRSMTEYAQTTGVAMVVQCAHYGLAASKAHAISRASSWSLWIRAPSA
jgi:hypothetical protein